MKRQTSSNPFRWMIIVALMLMSFMVACDDEKVSDEAALTSLIEEDLEELFGVEMFDADDNEQTGSLAKLADTIDIAGWRRIVSIRIQQILIEIDGNTAVATIDYLMTGDIVIASTDDSVYVKDVNHPIQRKVMFEQRASDRNRDNRRGWKRTGVSMAKGISTGGTIDFTEILIVTPDTSITVTDPVNTFFNADNLLTLDPGDEVEVFITTTEPEDNPLVGILHYGKARRHHGIRARSRFNDNGTGNDVTAGDNIYSGSWTVPQGHPFGIHRAVFDFMTAATLVVPDQPYNSTGVGLPYRIAGFDGGGSDNGNNGN